MKKILSLGGGVQSTAMFYLGLSGVMERPDFVVFADTGSEQKHTLDTVENIQRICREESIGFRRVTSEHYPIHEYYIGKGLVPQIKNVQCTDRFKIRPINKFVREIADESKPKPWVEMWLGITTDEIHRMRENPRKYVKNRFPLIEMGWTRNQCEAYLRREHPELVVEKSGCWHCHYQSAHKWAKLARESPELFQISRKMEEGAKANGMRKFGLYKGQSIAAFDNGKLTLEDFGMSLYPGDVDCSAEGGCFL